MDDGETEKLFEGIVVAVSMQQRVSVPEAKSRDQAIDCFPDGLPSRAQFLKISRGINRQFLAARLEHLEFP